MNQQMYVFGFGSLMNQESLQKTLPGKTMEGWAVLEGYHRAFNKAGRRGHRYLNLVADPSSSVKGVLVRVTPAELEHLKRREEGYNLVEVTRQVHAKPSEDSIVYAFIAPSSGNALSVSRRYLNTVLAAIPPNEREQWLEETDFEGAEIDEED